MGADLRESVAQAAGLYLLDQQEAKDSFGFDNSDWDECLMVGWLGDRFPEDHFAELLEELPGPAIITLDELSEAFDRYLPRPGTDVDLFDPEWFDERYPHFVDHVYRHLLRKRVSAPIPIAILTDLPSELDDWWRWLRIGWDAARQHLLGEESDAPAATEGEGESLDLDTEATLWQYEDIAVECCPLEFKGHVTGSSVIRQDEAILSVRVRGHLSPSSLKNMSADVERLVRSLVLSSSALEPRQQSRHERLEPVRASDLKTYLPFLREALGLALSPRKKGEHFDNRIANAVRLLAEADRQASTAIAIALCVAAIESLVGFKGGELKQRLSNSVARLLEADTKHRSQAVKFVARLYDVRSDILHGTRLDDEPSRLQDARRLAAGVLYAVWYFVDFTKRMGADPPKPESWIKELTSANETFFSDGPPERVPELPEVARLWRRS